MINENSKFEWWIWANNAEEALKDAGGILTIQQACESLQMSQDELRVRLEERSILFFEVPEMYGDGEIIIPAFQFEGKSHISGFHEVWDALVEECGVPQICGFFCGETFSSTGVRIFEVLRDKPDDATIKAILDQAVEFKIMRACAEQKRINEELEIEGESKESDRERKPFRSKVFGYLWFFFILIVGGLFFPLMALYVSLSLAWWLEWI